MPNPRHKPVVGVAREAFRRLLAVAGRLKFQPHRISRLLDSKGRHELTLAAEFPFAVSLFHFREGAFTQRLNWHERLELLVPHFRKCPPSARRRQFQCGRSLCPPNLCAAKMRFGPT